MATGWSIIPCWTRQARACLTGLTLMYIVRNDLSILQRGNEKRTNTWEQKA